MGHILDLANQSLVFTLEQGLLEHAPTAIDVDPNWMPTVPGEEEAFADIRPTPKGRPSPANTATENADELKPSTKRRSVGSSSSSATSTRPKPVEPESLEILPVDAVEEKPTRPEKTKSKKAKAKPTVKPPADEIVSEPLTDVLPEPISEPTLEVIEATPESDDKAALFGYAPLDEGQDDITRKPKRVSEARRLAMQKEENNEPEPSVIDTEEVQEASVEVRATTVEDMKPLPRALKLKITAKQARAQEAAASVDSAPAVIEEPGRISLGIQSYPVSPRFGLIETPSQPSHLQDTVHVSLKQTLSAAVQDAAHPEPAIPVRNTELLEPEELFFDIQPLKDVILFEAETETTAHHVETEEAAPPELWRVSTQMLSGTTKPLNHKLLAAIASSDNSEKDPTPPAETIAVKLLHLTTGFNPDKAFEEDLGEATWLDLEDASTSLELPNDSILGLEHGPLPGQEALESDRTLLFDETRIQEAGGQLLRIVQTLNQACLLLIERSDDFALAVDNGFALAILKTFSLNEAIAQDLEAIPLEVQLTRLPRKTLCAVTIGSWQGVICEDTRGVRLEAEVLAVD